MQLIQTYEPELGRNEKFQNEQREECIKKRWEALLQNMGFKDFKLDTKHANQADNSSLGNQLWGGNRVMVSSSETLLLGKVIAVVAITTGFEPIQQRLYET